MAAYMQANTVHSYPWIGMSTTTCASGCGGAANRAAQYTWSDGTPFDYEAPNWSLDNPQFDPLDDAAPNYGHYYNAPGQSYNGWWGTLPEWPSEWGTAPDGVCQTAST